jgi:hypothetical protein
VIALVTCVGDSRAFCIQRYAINKEIKMAAKKEATVKKQETQSAPQQKAQTSGAKDTSPKLTTLTTGFLRKKATYDRQFEAMTRRLDSARQNVSRLEEQITKTELQLSALEAPRMADELIGPLAKEIMRIEPSFKSYEAVGPVGSQQAVVLSFYPDGVSEEDRLKGRGCKSVTLVTRIDDEICLGVRDYSVVDESIKPGTVSFANGLQYKVIVTDENSSAAWLASHLK